MFRRVHRVKSILQFLRERAPHYGPLVRDDLHKFRDEIVKASVGACISAAAGLIFACFLSVAVIVSAWDSLRRTAVAWAVCGGCLVAFLLFNQGCTSLSAQVSDHFDRKHFHNRENVPEPTFWDEAKVAWQLKTKKNNWPPYFETKPFAVPKEPLAHGIRVLWLGHSGALVQTPKLNIIADPVFSDFVGPNKLFGIKTVTNSGLIIESLPTIDLILISHSHYDHLDLKSIHTLLDRQKDNPPKILVGLGVGELLKSEGISSYLEMDWNDSIAVNGSRIYFLEAVHTSRRGVWDNNKTLWGSFLIDSPEGAIYFAGDTAYGHHFKNIFEKFGAPKVSLLPIGAYEPRWYMYREHMNPPDAVKAHLDLHSQNSIGIHFGLIDNAGESYEAPTDDLTGALTANRVDGSKFIAPSIGQVFEY